MTIEYRSETLITVSTGESFPVRMTRNTRGGYRISQGSSWINVSPETLDAIVAAADELDDSKPVSVTPAKYVARQNGTA